MCSWFLLLRIRRGLLKNLEPICPSPSWRWQTCGTWVSPSVKLSGPRTRKLPTAASVRRNSASHAGDITAVIVVIYSATLVATTRCLFPPPPAQSEFVIRATLSCCNATPILKFRCVAACQLLKAIQSICIEVSYMHLCTHYTKVTWRAPCISAGNGTALCIFSCKS